jgi:hypothetical protein
MADMSTSIRAGETRSIGRVWQTLGLKREGGELDYRMWLVTLPAIAMAVISRPSVTISAQYGWVNETATFATMVALATIYALTVMALVHRFTKRGRSSHLLLSCWWIGTGAIVGLSASWMAACLIGAGAAVVMHLIVRQLAFQE